MSRLALFAALLVLVACGGAPTDAQRKSLAGPSSTAGNGSTNTTLPDGGTGEADAGTPAAVVTYSLDCTGESLGSSLTFHTETLSDGDGGTDCTATLPDGGVASVHVSDPTAESCGFYVQVAGGADDGWFSCQKHYSKDEAYCQYFETGDLTHTVAYLDCAVTTP